MEQNSSILFPAMRLHDATGERLHLTADERRALMAAAAKAERPTRTPCAVLHGIGRRIGEALALALAPGRIDPAGRAVVLESLERRRGGVDRASSARIGWRGPFMG